MLKNCEAMIKIILSLLISVSVFSQTESPVATDGSPKSKPISETTGMLGYHFYEGGFMNARLSNTTQFQYGVLNVNVENFQIVEVPFIFKQNLGNKFKAFFGAKVNLVSDTGFRTLQLSDNQGSEMGVSLEMGLQYDVNDNFMLEMRYSLPVKQSSSLYPSQMDYNNFSLFRVGSMFKF